MTWLIVAGALGAISITGGLFLRRLLGELVALRGQLTELRRQITGIDRQLRAQRAHVNILRQLLAEDGDTTDGSSPPPQAAVANGNDPAAGHGPEIRPPARRKRHLGLYLGGVAAALAAISGVVREIATAHRAQIVGAVTGAAMTAATVTVVTVQPWTDDAGHKPPAAAPPASSPPTTAPPETDPPQLPASMPPAPGASPPTTAPETPGASPSPSPSWGNPSTGPRPWFTGVPIVPAGAESPASHTSAAAPDDASHAAGSTPPDGSPEPSPEPSKQPEEPPIEPPPVTAEPAESGPCLDLSVPPLLDTDTCLLD
ncbi:hypothetical protein [Streptomyces tendae]|uniref:Uncharacterized protein n=1 Tax=Streptomyces tendae TaxID=1932 RepID=A0ABW7S8V5_STRTE